MARLFVRLKLRLIRNGLRLGGLRTISLVSGGAFAGVVALVGFGAFAAPPERPDVHAAVPVLGFAAVFAAWIVAPALGFGLDETLDPARFALLPLTRRQLVTGLLAASATGAAPLATLVTLLGTLVGYSDSTAAAVTIGAAVVVEFALCLASARAVTAAISRLLTSRRARDVWVVVASLLVFGVQALIQSLRFLGDRVGSDVWFAIARFIRWAPPAMVGRAVVDAEAGRIGVASVEVLAGAGAVALAMAWWAHSLERSLTATTQTPLRRSGARPPRARSSLFPRFASWLPRDRRGAVAAKDLRYFWRDPMQRAARFNSAIVAAAAIAALLVFARSRRPEITLAAAALMWWLTLGSTTQFGFDRTAYWTNVAAAGDPAHDLLGKNIAFAVASSPVFVIVALVLTLLTGGWVYLPVAIATGVGVLGVALGVGTVVSVRLPQPMPESTTNLWAQRTGQGCGTVLVLLLALLVEQVVVAPIAIVVLVTLAWSRAFLGVAAAFAIGYGAVVCAVGHAVAGSWLRAHEPELLELLSARRA